MTDRRIDDGDDYGLTMRRKSLWDGRITFGNLLTIIAMAIGGSGVYAKMVSTAAAGNERLHAESELRKADEAQLNRLIDTERQDMHSIADGLQTIDTKIEDVRKNIDDVRERLGQKADRRP